MNSKWGTYPWFGEHGVDLIHPDILWHYDKHKHYYLVSVRGKKRSRRYWEEEFM